MSTKSEVLLPSINFATTQDRPTFDQNDDMVKDTLEEVSRRLNNYCSDGYRCKKMSEERSSSGNYSQNGISLPSTNSSLASCLLSPDLQPNRNGFIRSNHISYSLKDISRASDWRALSRRPQLPSVTPNKMPPPLKRNLSCMSLRTPFRSDEPGLVDANASSSFGVSAFETPSGVTFGNRSVLPPITTQAARTKSFVVGNISSQGSLLGMEELKRYFPNQRVRIFLGTWNMNGQNSPENLEDFLLPKSVECLSDIYVIAIQEGLQDRREWEITVQACLGPSHILFHSAALGVLYLCVFLRRDLIWFCSVAEDDCYSTRPLTMVKTKGAVAISYVFFGTSFLFINSHLTAHASKLRERIIDYEKICQMIDLPKIVPSKLQFGSSKDVTTKFDCVFWCGDLNFRLEHDRSAVIKVVDEVVKKRAQTFEYLLLHDQLKKAMSNGVAFHGFQEGQIHFGPSYKFNSGTTEFDSIKLRVPSYTDRVLYRSRVADTIECVKYSMVPEIISSDHKPVFAVCNVQLRPGRDNIPLAAGLFNRDVYLEAMKRRARALEIKSSKDSLVCTVM